MAKFRIKKYPRGYVVEVEKTRGWLRQEIYWEHFISAAGIDSAPWHFSSYEYAMESLLKQIRWQTIEESND